MAESRNRDLATSLGQAVKNNTITSTGSLAVVGLTAYDSAGLLPSSYDSNNAGTLGFAEDSDKLYIHTGQGWFNIAIINTTPIFTASPSASYDLATDATAYNNGTATVITLAARDSEGFPVTFSATGNSAFNNIAYVSQDSSVFTIIPKSQDSVGEAAPADGTLTFSVTDGINTASAASTFSLTFDTSVANSESTHFFTRATGNNQHDRTLTDESDSPHTITYSTSSNANKARLTSWTPFAPGGYSTYFGSSIMYGATSTVSTFLKIRNSSMFAWGSPSGNTNDFTIETWIYPIDDEGVGAKVILDMRGTSTSNTAVYMWFQPSGMLFVQGHGSNLGGSDKYVEYNAWNHIALVRHGNDLKLYLNGIQNGSTADVTSVNYNHSSNSQDIYVGRHNPTSASTTNDARFQGYMCDLRFVRGTAVYTSEFTPPTTFLETIDKTIFHIFRKNAPYIYGMGGFSAHQSHSYGSQFIRSGGTSADVSPGSQTITMAGHTPYKMPEQYSGSSHGGSVFRHAQLKVAGHADFQFGSSTAFTVELWWKAMDGHPGNSRKILVSNLTSSGTGFAISSGSSGTTDDGKITVSYGTSSSETDLLVSPKDYGYLSNKSTVMHWTHIAYTFDGTTHRLFVNGESVDSDTGTVNYNSSGDLIIGTGASQIIGPMRIVKGTAAYSTVYGFFPPIGVFTKTGSTYFSLKDPFSGSSGNTSVNNSIPAAHTVFLANWGTSGIFNATGAMAYHFNSGVLGSATAGEGPISSTGSQKYSVPSIYYDKTTADRLEGGNDMTEPATRGIFKNEAVTYEGWFQWSGTAETQFGIDPNLFTFVSNRQTNYTTTGDARLSARPSNSGRLRLHLGSGVLDDSSSHITIDHHSGNLLDGNWHHVAMTRNNGKIYLFVDGVQGTTTASTTSRISYTSNFGIGGGGSASNDGNNGTPGGGGSAYGGGWNGYISQVRQSKGVSRYPFEPKKETLTTSTSFQNGITVTASNTKLLTAHAASITDASSTGHTVTANGNAAVSSWAPNGGMKSVYLDGTGDYLSVASNAEFGFGTGDFTIECWFYNAASNYNNYPNIFSQVNEGATNFRLFIFADKFRYRANSSNALDGTTTLVVKKWYHVALVRKSGTTRIFLNGSPEGNTYSDSINYSADALVLGQRGSEGSGGTYFLNGYISNFRIVKGQAIYDVDFTPPSEAMYG